MIGYGVPVAVGYGFGGTYLGVGYGSGNSGVAGANGGFGNNGNAFANGFAGNANLPNGQLAGGNNGPANFNPQAAPNPNAQANDAPNPPALDLPARTWTDEAGNAIVEGQFVGVLDGSVVVRKTTGGVRLVSLGDLSDTDRQYVTSVAGHRPPPKQVAEDSQ